MFGHKHKYPTLKNISLKYLINQYQHLTSSDRVISQSMNNTRNRLHREEIAPNKFIEVGGWTRAAMGWAIHQTGLSYREQDFAECGTRQISLYRVSDKKHSAKLRALGKEPDSGSALQPYDYCTMLLKI
jgi:hypothetical protein